MKKDVDLFLSEAKALGVPVQTLRGGRRPCSSSPATTRPESDIPRDPADREARRGSRCGSPKAVKTRCWWRCVYRVIAAGIFIN